MGDSVTSCLEKRELNVVSPPTKIRKKIKGKRKKPELPDGDYKPCFRNDIYYSEQKIVNTLLRIFHLLGSVRSCSPGKEASLLRYSVSNLCWVHSFLLKFNAEVGKVKTF